MEKLLNHLRRDPQLKCLVKPSKRLDLQIEEECVHLVACRAPVSLQKLGKPITSYEDACPVETLVIDSAPTQSARIGQSVRSISFCRVWLEIAANKTSHI